MMVNLFAGSFPQLIRLSTIEMGFYSPAVTSQIDGPCRSAVSHQIRRTTKPRASKSRGAVFVRGKFKCTASVEVLTLRDICQGRVPERVLKR